MNGGDKILSRIKADCDKVVSAIISESDSKCAEIISQAEIQAKKASESISEKTDAKVKQIENSSKSRCELEIRNSLLTQRRAEIDKTIDEVLNYLLSQNDSDYFSYIYKLAETLNVKEGTVYLNKKDLDRLPGDFTDNFKKSGIDIKVGENAVDIVGGFILKNGKIEENMAFDAVIMSKRDVLEDIISRELFK